MATAREWADGYLKQAQADLNAARILQGQEPSVEAMLLQMILEKLGKAGLLRTGQINATRAHQTHRAASAMVKQLARNARACARLNYRPETVRNAIAPLVDRLERSQPGVTPGGPHLEYPWESRSGAIEWPAQHLEAARAFRPTSTHGLRLYHFVNRLFERFNEVFP